MIVKFVVSCKETTKDVAHSQDFVVDDGLTKVLLVLKLLRMDFDTLFGNAE